MKTLIAFASNRGCTRRASELLADQLEGAVLVDLRKDPNPDLDNRDTVVIGGSIRMGRIQKAVRAFCQANLEALANRKLGLYICCMGQGEDARKQFETAYPGVLRDHAAAVGLFGGEFIFAKMSFIERMIVKKAAGITEDVSTLDHGAIARFARALREPDRTDEH